MAQNINCRFKYIKTAGIIYQSQRILRHIINKFSKKYIGNEYIHMVKKKIKKEGEKYDLIIIENEPQYGLIIEKVKEKAKLILHLHNDYLNENSKNAKVIYNTYDEIFAISNFISNRVNNIQPNIKKAKVLYNGIDINRFNLKEEEIEKLRKKYDLKKSDFVFMYVGRIAKEKGIKQLIQAFNKIENESAKLVITGNKQPGQEEFYKEIIELIGKNKKNIIFTGYVNYNEIQKIYALSDVGVVPSICNEAFGLSATEFMASGKPVIVSNQGALPEIIDKTECGKIVNYNEEFINNLKNVLIDFLNLEDAKMEELKRNAIINANKYTKEIYIKNFLKLIREGTNEKK